MPLDDVRVVQAERVDPLLVVLLWRPDDQDPALRRILAEARRQLADSAEEDAAVDQG